MGNHGAMADISGSHSLEIDAPVEVCFDIAADVERAPEWQGAMKSAKALEHDDEGRPTLVDTEIDSGVTKNRLLLRFAYDEPHGMTWTRESGDLKSLEGRWDFEDLGDGRTRATYSMTVDLGRMLGMVIRGPLVGVLRGQLVDTMPEKLKTYVEGR